MFCCNCGSKLSDEQNFCFMCGKPVLKDLYPPQDHSPAPVQSPAQRPFVNYTPETVVPPSPAPTMPEVDPVPVFSASDGKKEKKPRKKKAVFFILAAVVVLAVAASLFFVRAKKQDRYGYASSLLSAQKYADAAEVFEELGGYKDSPALSQYARNCENYYNAEALFSLGDYKLALTYYEELGDFADAADKSALCRRYMDLKQAEKLMSEEDYEGALALYDSLGDFEDAGEKAAYCAEAIRYTQAVSLFNSGAYDEAKAIFAALTEDFEKIPAYLDGCDKMTELTARLDDMDQGNYRRYTSLPQIDPALLSANPALRERYEIWSTYYEAVGKYNAGACYQAMLLFDELGSFADAEERSAACPQPDPKTGELYRNQSFSKRGVTLKVVMPDDGTKNVIKIYSQSGTLVSVAFVAPGGSISIALPAGTYMVKDGYSTGSWYGSEDMFGPNGTYLIMTFGNSEYFTLQSGYYYTMTLRTSKTDGDPVGEKRDDWNGF